MARPRARRAGNLSAEATSFVGRRRELAEVRNKLAADRLVSLVGPGGVGKTRLAVRSARDLGRGFRDGAWLVELAEVRDAALVTHAVMAALDLRDQAASTPLRIVLAYLADKELLLIVDNCEHVLDAVAQLVAQILRTAPGVRIIATSRETLSVAGEHVVAVPPLELPSASPAEPLDRLRQNDAVLLFMDRAAAASGSFELTSANRAHVVDICRRLDGLPLAIELAAVRTRVLSTDQIRDRLSDRFSLLTRGNRAALPRHQTLRTAIDWSYDLLQPGERDLLLRLCVFAGLFMLEDVQAVCMIEQGAADALDAMSSLVEKSLVTRADAGRRVCYRLHETMREYARSKLRDAGEEEGVEQRFAEYYLSACLRTAMSARYRLLEWLEWMDLEIDNIRAVLRRCLLRSELAHGIDLVTSLTYFWITRATTEGVRWLDELLASDSERPAAHPWAYYARGFLGVLQSDAAAARRALDVAIAAASEAGQRPLLAQALAMASIGEDMAGDQAAARGLLERAQAVAVGLENDLPTTLMLLQARSLDGLFGHDLNAVRAASTEGERLSRVAGDLYSLEMMLINLGMVALMDGDLHLSVPLLDEALRIAAQIDDRVAQCYVLEALGCLAASAGQARRAAHLFGAAETVRVGAGANIIAMLAPFRADALKLAVAALGQARFGLELENGKRLVREAAIALALGEPGRAPVVDSDAANVGPLGKREADIARLLAEGLSNKQIAAQLFISERTVDSHVRSILNKLGFNSRTQVAAWMASSH